MTIKRIFDLLDHYKENWPDRQIVLSGKDNGTWVNYSIDDFIEKANNLSYGLLAMGLQKNDNLSCPCLK